MGSGGFRRVTPVHVRALVKRYRQLLGELRYCRRHIPADIDRLARLETGIHALTVSVHSCTQELDLSSLRPIRYAPPVPLPGNALVRAVLAELRSASTGLNVDDLLGRLRSTHNLSSQAIPGSPPLSVRVLRCLNALRRRGVIASRETLWLVAR